MINPRVTSSVVLITLAELAWLAAFGLLFAYRGKVGELGVISRQLQAATNSVAQWEATYPRAATLSKEVNELQLENRRLTSLESKLAEVTEARAQSLTQLTAAQAELARLRASFAVDDQLGQKLKDLERKLAEVTEARTKSLAEQAAAQAESARLRAALTTAPQDATEMAEQYRNSQDRVAELEEQVLAAQTLDRKYQDLARQREVGEFSVRRELTGLPDKELRRVIFLVDTSASMRNSPAWAAARKLIRTWLEFLSVEECALVSFNDKAVGFPKDGYLRVRETDGTKLAEEREQLLRTFDKAAPGTYTDLLLGFRRAYEYPAADIIVLFTDGHPHVGHQSDSSFARDILSEAAKYPHIPVLTVALGNYEIEGAGGPRPRTNAPIRFLKELAHQTGGNFLAR